MHLLAAWIAAASLAAFVAAGLDKRWAIQRCGRMPESALLGLALVGGSPGLLAGMLAFRHKTQKGSFQLRFALVVAVQFALAYLALTR